MLNILTTLLFLSLLNSPLHAGDEIPLSRSSLVAFPHKQHQKSLGGCVECHGTNVPGPIVQFDGKWAHATCTGCHSESKTGPVECGGCHVQY